MANWYYYNTSGEKIEVTGGQLKQLALQGTITPETMIETEEGKSAPARRVKGLTFAETKQPEAVKPIEPEVYGLASPPSPTEPNPFSIALSESDNPFTAPLSTLTESAEDNPFTAPMAVAIIPSAQPPANVEIANRRNVLLALLGVFIIGVGIIIIREQPWTEESQQRYREHKQRRQERTGGTPIDVMAGGLMFDYIENKKAADKKYKDKTLIVSGTIHSVDRYASMPSVTLLAGSTDRTVLCVFPASQGGVGFLAFKNKGDFITIKGKCAGFASQPPYSGAVVGLSNCSIEE